MKKKMLLCLLTIFLFTVFVTGCDVEKEKSQSYLNAKVIEVRENTLIVKSTDNKETKAPKEVKEAEKLTLDFFNEDSVEKGDISKIKIVFAIYRMDKNGDIITE